MPSPSNNRNHYPITILASLALAYVAINQYYGNSFGFFDPSRLLTGLALAILLSFGMLFFAFKFLLKGWANLEPQKRKVFLLSSLLLALLFLLIFPPNSPALNQDHTLTLRATGTKNEASQDSNIEILKIRYANGVSLPVEALSMTPDWSTQDGSLISNGCEDSAITLSGKMPGGIILNLRYSSSAGIAAVSWDGEEQLIDLYAPQEKVILPLVLGTGLTELSLINQVVTIIFWLLYLAGLFFIIILTMVILRLLFGVQRSDRVICLLASAILFGLFIYLKLSYLDFLAPRVYNDTLSYVITAEHSLLSASFWLGLRPFTYPLFLSLLNVNQGNYTSVEMMQVVTTAQAWISIFCWASLAISVSQAIRQEILRPLVFGCILMFSVTPEISLWDFSVISESFTLSCFALMLAVWIWLFTFFAKPEKPGIRWLFLALSLLATLLYVFTRDSNIYLVLICSITFLAASLFIKHFKPLRQVTLIFLVLSMGIYFFHSFSLSTGDRWQVFLYDQLAMRILKSETATQFFVENGLPDSQKLRSTANMTPGEYQPIYKSDPELGPVREWVARDSKRVYISYLLDDLPGTLVTPLLKYNKLLNSNNLEYRNPKYGVLPISSQIDRLVSILYNQNTLALLITGLLAIAGLIYFLIRNPGPVWLVLLAVILTMYPAMGLIWHAEPMEIERHALQIGIQFRLAGLIVFLFLAQEIYTAMLQAPNPPEHS
jgi:hypothetical protein